MPPAQFAALGNPMQTTSKLSGANSQSTSLYGIFGLLTTLVTVGAVARGEHLQGGALYSIREC